jgi:hypothetical protein
METWQRDARPEEFRCIFATHAFHVFLGGYNSCSLQREEAIGSLDQLSFDSQPLSMGAL